MSVSTIRVRVTLSVVVSVGTIRVRVRVTLSVVVSLSTRKRRKVLPRGRTLTLSLTLI